MERKKSNIVYLDTHIVEWLCSGLFDKISDKAKDIINSHDIAISPMVKLELQYLYDIKRTTKKPDYVINKLAGSIGLYIDKTDFDAVITKALDIDWTRDLFDRIIVATAKLTNSPLITADRLIREKYKAAVI